MDIRAHFILTNRLDFETHLRYVGRLASLSKALTLSCNVDPVLDKKRLVELKNKIQLIELTKKSIEDERGIVIADQEYSTAAVLWLPIKTYYLIYHSLCAIDFILTGNSTALSAGHFACIDKFSKMLAENKIAFSQILFNEVFDKSILNFRSAPGSHLSNSAPDELIYKLTMKKAANEKIENYKIANGITSTRKKHEKEKMMKFENRLNVSIFDFFHIMRLRLNYRNINFMSDIPANDTKAYFDRYFKASMNFFEALTNLRNQLIAKISTH